MKYDRPATYRVSDEDREWLESHWKNMNTATNMAVKFYKALRAPILKQVEAKVNGDDIACLVTVLEGSQMNPQFMASTKSLIGNITARAEQIDDKQLKSDMLLLAEKAKSFTPPECYVLQEEIHRRLAMKS